MSIKLFDEVRLKDGREGCVTDILDETHFSIDIGMEKWENIDVSVDEIEEVLKHG